MPTHLLILTPGFPKDEGDTPCIPPLQSYLLSLKELYPEIQITVISFQYPFINRVYDWNGIKVHAVAGKNKRGFGKLATWWKVIRYAQEIIKQQPVDLIHSFWLGECTYVGNQIRKSKGIPHVNTVMGQDAKGSNSYLKYLNVSADTQLVVLSPYQAEILERSIKRTPEMMIPWGIIPSDFPKEEPSQKRDIDLLGVGSLIPLKNYRLLVKLVKEVKPQYPEIKCCIVGSGSEEHALKRLIHEWELEDNITLTGRVTREEVLKYMKRSQILVHPSLYESYGYIFPEALYSGMYSLSFKVGIAPSELANGKFLDPVFGTHPKWKVAEDEADMLRLLYELLEMPKDFQRGQVHMMEDAVKAYMYLYSELSPNFVF